MENIIKTITVTIFEKFILKSLFIVFIFIIIAIIIGIILHIFLSISLWTIAKRLNIKEKWLAWIPILNLYLLTKIAFKNKLIPFTLLISLLLAYLIKPYSIFFISFFVLLIITCLFNVYKRLSNKAIIMIIFTILSGGLLAPFLLFAIRHNELRY